jgi:TetR/AcrR family transcriptional regulator
MERLERKEREFNVRRADILEQAERIFSTKGFHNVTVAEIANASGFAIGSLYQFFEGKEHLYTTMISEKLDLMYAEIRKEVNAAKDVADKIVTLINAHLKFVENNTDFCRIFLRGENDAISEIMTALHQKLIDDYFKHITFIENFLKTGIKGGLLRSLPPHEMALALIHLIRSAAIEWLLIPTKESLLSKRDFILDIFLNGAKKI